MAITASYVDASTLNMVGDYRYNLPMGVAIRANCGTDGIKIVYVSKSEYKGGKTIVYLVNSESDDLTANLVNLDISSVKPNSMQLEGNSGNIPVDWLWLYRGSRRGMALSWISTDRIDILPGAMHITYENREIYAILESTVSLTGFSTASLTVNTWYYIYLYPLVDETCVIPAASSSFFYSSTAPTFSSTTMQWGHPTEPQFKCIGFFLSGSSGSSVRQFFWTSKFYQLNYKYWFFDVGRTAWSNWQYNMQILAAIPLTIPTELRIFAQMDVSAHLNWQTATNWYYRPYGCTRNTDPWFIYHQAYQYGQEFTQIGVHFDNNKLLPVKTGADTAQTYYLRTTVCHFKLPVGFCEA